jgi:hypothetical protein
MYGRDQQMLGAINSATMAATSYGDAVAKQQPEIPEQIGRLSSAIESAHDCLRELAGRLESVTRPLPPEPAGSAANKLASVGPSTSCGAHLYANVTRVQDLSEHLRDLLRRLEV